MTEIRCKKCNRLLMKAVIIDAEVKCPKCGYLNMTKFEPMPLPKILKAVRAGMREASKIAFAN